jgi:hypothetical protein
MLGAMSKSSESSPRSTPLVARTDAGWMLPALFFGMGAPVAGLGGWMWATGSFGTGATVGVFGVGFLLLTLRLALETARARIELHDHQVVYVTPWWTRRVPYEEFEELAIEEVRTIDRGKESVRRFYSLRPRRRRGMHFSSAWPGSGKVVDAVRDHGIQVNVALFTIDRDQDRRDAEDPDRPWLSD